MGTKKTTAQGSTRKRLLKYFWGTFLVGILSIIFLFLLADWGVFGEMPDFKRLENPETNLASSIYSADDELLGKFYFNDNRTPVTYKDLPEHLVNALIATEDERFEKHSGIDMRGTLRAIVFLGRRGGASTITQQLAKLLFHREGSLLFVWKDNIPRRKSLPCILTNTTLITMPMESVPPHVSILGKNPKILR